MIKWHLEKVKIKDLKEHPKNPRQISKEQYQNLEELIKKFGLIDRPIVNLDMTIIGGHQRVKILKKMKEKEVEVWVPDHILTDEEVDHLCVGLNLNQGQWDWDILANNFDALNLLEWGFSEEQLTGAFKEPEEIQNDDGEHKSKKKKKMQMCPSCGHEFS